MIKRIISRSALLLLIISLTLTGCTDGEVDEGVSVGYVYYDGYGVIDGGSLEHGAYRSEKSVFDINDVSLIFSFGIRYSEPPESNFNFYGPYDIYLKNDDGVKYFVRSSDENLTSPEYSISSETEKIDDSHSKTTYKFNHEEVIVIPSALFSKDSGKIYLCIYGENLTFPENGTVTIVHESIYYEKLDGGTKIKIKQLKYPWEEEIND